MTILITLQAINSLQQVYPTITTEPISLALLTNYNYHPSNTVQITYTEAHHGVFHLSMHSKITRYENPGLI